MNAGEIGGEVRRSREEIELDRAQKRKDAYKRYNEEKKRLGVELEAECKEIDSAAALEKSETINHPDAAQLKEARTWKK